MIRSFCVLSIKFKILVYNVIKITMKLAKQNQIITNANFISCIYMYINFHEFFKCSFKAFFYYFAYFSFEPTTLSFFRKTSKTEKGPPHLTLSSLTLVSCRLFHLENDQMEINLAAFLLLYMLILIFCGGFGYFYFIFLGNK